MLCYAQKWVIHWCFKFWVFTFWNLSQKTKCRVTLANFFWPRFACILVSLFFFYSRQVCNKRLANGTAVTDTLTLNRFTRNTKHGFNSRKWSNLAWNCSSILTIYFGILPLCGLQMLLRETHWFPFRHWKNDIMLLTICVFEKFYFSFGKIIRATLSERKKYLDSLSLLSNCTDSLATDAPSKMRKCAELPEHLRSEYSFVRTCNIPNLISYVYGIALSKCFTGCVSTSGFSNTNCSEGQIRTYEATGGRHYDADATMAIPEPIRNSF